MRIDIMELVPPIILDRVPGSRINCTADYKISIFLEIEKIEGTKQARRHDPKNVPVVDKHCEKQKQSCILVWLTNRSDGPSVTQLSSKKSRFWFLVFFNVVRTVLSIRNLCVTFHVWPSRSVHARAPTMNSSLPHSLPLRPLYSSVCQQQHQLKAWLRALGRLMVHLLPSL